MSTSNTPAWEELLGSDNWSGLLEPPPMNLELRKFILKCRNFAEATYDAFESDPNFPHSGDQVNGRQEIYVAWRGTSTSTSSEWESNIAGFPLLLIEPLIKSETDRSLWSASDGEPKVHNGFLSIYTSISGGSSYVRSSAKAQLWAVIQDLKT